MVTLQNISKKYKDFSLREIDLSIEHGEIVSLLGASGSGKSTLLKIILGMIDDYSGKVLIDEKSTKGSSPIDMGISMVFQNPLLLPHFTVEENIAFGLKMINCPKHIQKERVKQSLVDVCLEGFETRYPCELSGGQQQRVSLARALVMNPRLLLMDEPFSALDQNLRIEMQKLLKAIQKSYQSTIVFVTHDRDEAFFLSDKIALLQQGKLLQYDTPKNLYDKPINIDVANFLGIQNIFKGQIENQKFIHSDFILNIPNCRNNIDNSVVALKSTDIRVVETSHQDSLRGVVHSIILRYGVYELEIRIGKTIFHIKQNKIVHLNVGDEVYIHYYSHDIIVFPY